MKQTRLLSGQSRRAGTAVLCELMNRWARRDPDAALQMGASFKGTLRQYLLNQVALASVEENPRSGLEFVLANPGMMPPFFSKDIPGGQELLPLIQRLPESGAKFHLIKNALKGLPLTEAFRAMGGMSGYSTAFARNSLLRERAKTSLHEVIAFHSEASGGARHAAAHAVGDALVKTDPAAAVEWAKANLSGYLRTDTIKAAAKNLLEEDPAAAAAARVLLPENFGPSPPEK